MKKKSIHLVAASLLFLAGNASVNAASLLTLADGTFGELAMSKNDDSSSSLLDLPFQINFYGNNYNKFFVNNNGNISFNRSIGSYTPEAFPVASQPMIAPYWADVDTRCVNCGDVYVGALNADTVLVTWNNVGYFSENADKTNNFQLALRNQNNGNFDIEFRYDNLQWTTGDASEGVNGVGGIPAQAGFDAGDNLNYFTLPGSFSNNILGIQNATNVVGGDPGFWAFSILNGLTPGSTPNNPLMPIVVDNTFSFDFNVVQPSQMVYIDPTVAVGYDYSVTSGSNIASVLLPTGFGDNLFDLHLWNGSEYVFSSSITGGSEYDFAPGGVSQFRILGIEESLAIDPNNPNAFVTGLTFVSPGQVSMLQSAITAQVNPVPLPSAGIFMISGIAGLIFGGRKKLNLNYSS